MSETKTAQPVRETPKISGESKALLLTLYDTTTEEAYGTSSRPADLLRERQYAAYKAVKARIASLESQVAVLDELERLLQQVCIQIPARLPVEVRVLSPTSEARLRFNTFREAASASLARSTTENKK